MGLVLRPREAPGTSREGRQPWALRPPLHRAVSHADLSSGHQRPGFSPPSTGGCQVLAAWWEGCLVGGDPVSDLSSPLMLLGDFGRMAPLRLSFVIC